jgi:hypothetical protein
MKHLIALGKKWQKEAHELRLWSVKAWTEESRDRAVEKAIILDACAAELEIALSADLDDEIKMLDKALDKDGDDEEQTEAGG